VGYLEQREKSTLTHHVLRAARAEDAELVLAGGADEVVVAVQLLMALHADDPVHGGVLGHLVDVESASLGQAGNGLASRESRLECRGCDAEDLCRSWNRIHDLSSLRGRGSALVFVSGATSPRLVFILHTVPERSPRTG
jgi:hypothetical protein